MDLVRPSIVLFGDSITQHSFAKNGWAAALANDYSVSMDIFNRGFSGYNTRWANLIVKHCINSEIFRQVEVVTIFFGANDAVVPNLIDRFSRQHVPIEEYKQNLIEIANYVKNIQNRDGTSPHVLIIGPPPADEEKWHSEMKAKWGEGRPVEEIPCNRSLKATELYSKAASEAAKETGSTFIDCYNAFIAKDDWKSMFEDGLHPNENGQQVLYSLVRNALDELPRGRLKIENVSPQFPHHSEIDENDPAAKLMSVIPGSWLK